ncbi:MAG: hypothetical protein AAF558_09320 [Verrucomicrobiota bacterium]
MNNATRESYEMSIDSDQFPDPAESTSKIPSVHYDLEVLIRQQKDREASLLAGQLLAEMLRELLEKVLVDSVFQSPRKLFEPYGPLNSFGNLLSLSYAFGQISSTEYHSILIIKRIQDLAEHSNEDSFSFTNSYVQKIIVGAMTTPSGTATEIDEGVDSLAKSDPWLAFRVVFCNAQVKLLARISAASQISPAPDLD